MVQKNGAKRVENIVAASSATGDVLGYIVFFSGHECIVPFDEIHQALDNEGLDGSTVVPEVRAINTASRAFRHAKTALKQRSGDESTRDEYRVKFIRSDAGDRVYSLLKINVNWSATEARGDQETLITVRADGRIETSAPADKADELIAAFNAALGKATDADIRQGAIRFCIVDCLGFAINPNGGTYFIPPSSIDKIERLSRGLAPWLETFVGTLHNDARGLNAMGASCERSLISDVAGFERECDAFAEREVRESTLKDRLVEFADLSARAEFYKTAFGAKLATFDSKIAALQKRVQDMLSGVESSAEERAAKSEAARAANQAKHVETLRIAREALRHPAATRDAFVKDKCAALAKTNGYDADNLAEIVSRRMSAMASREQAATSFDSSAFLPMVKELFAMDESGREARIIELANGNETMARLLRQATMMGN